MSTCEITLFIPRHDDEVWLLDLPAGKTNVCRRCIMKKKIPDLQPGKTIRKRIFRTYKAWKIIKKARLKVIEKDLYE